MGKVISLPEATGNVAALNLYQHFGRFGVPKELRSDRGSYFANTIIAEFLRLVARYRLPT
jgi:hypothetical protein